MGVNRAEKTTLITCGPYRIVRHPIYLFQLVMLLGVTLLLPAPLTLVILIVHLACVLVKAADEEAYLRSLHGQEYLAYLARTGRLLPRFRLGGARTG
jgi:protein-S-isoprenylcysteine O-methyltransferase Ste14